MYIYDRLIKEQAQEVRCEGSAADGRVTVRPLF